MIRGVQRQVEQGPDSRFIDQLNPDLDGTRVMIRQGVERKKIHPTFKFDAIQKRHPDWRGEKVTNAKSHGTSCPTGPLHIAAY